ncbi:calcium/sodium antiporter [Ruixingdingia sedimenti]|uniref:Calcium/sodium antiporter n=1 Tax=Ruixingdingia sedimenti TaxID=3073604 RepID=A0ABU1F4L1_9RHOB|nr:calcium/sodium antiporter [Xinfangfangia sp. LG-4]MDR5651800.1 calcium/sodium antiporter [Xinfangfangia sp. LG-4]
MTYLLFLLGLVGLFFGGEWLVRGASGIARRYHVPPMVIGLTIVGFGTSTPELLVSVQAALAGIPGIAIGNVVGSNIANILLILGLSAAVGPMAAQFRSLRGDLGWMLAAALACVPVFWSGAVGRAEGALLFAGILVYIGLALRRVGSARPAADDAPPPALGLSLALTLGGLVVLMVGARLLVDSATDIARTFGLSEAVIGLTIVAVGTSLPELATSITAALRGHRDIALGNVVGSNIFNILAILGLTALVQPIPVETRFLALDLPVMIAVTLLLAGMLWWRGGLGRLAGAGFLALYAAYTVTMAAV